MLSIPTPHEYLLILLLVLHGTKTIDATRTVIVGFFVSQYLLAQDSVATANIPENVVFTMVYRPELCKLRL